jgi:oligopeptidase B
MSDPSLPLTPPEWPEWGNPIENPDDYDTILAYSPYDQVTPRRYPPIYASGGLTDSRVTYWEPAKWIARLRDRAPRGGPYYLTVNMTAGHTGSAGRYDGLREGARDYAFALKAVGDPDAGAPLK